MIPSPFAAMPDPHDRHAPGASGSLGRLDRIALEMTGTLELDRVLEGITRGLVEDFGVQLARVWLVEPDDPNLHLRASSGLSTRLDGNYARVPIGSRKIGRIAETREALWTNDVAHDERIADHAWASANGLTSFAGWPLTFRGGLEGVLGTFARRPLGEADRARMSLFAHQAAIAIKNARLFATVSALEERLQAENAYLRREVAGEDDAATLLARCEGLAEVVSEIRKVAPTTTTVLVQGETGTGKELVARAIHELGSRRAGPLVKVNCAALSPSLVESELFGHEKGAFTGAQQRRIGRFELADGGTLFLDEVGELPLELQPKLLRVLQEQEFERVGAARPTRVDVRIVSATNRDLQKAVEAGRFRADLFYRLACVLDPGAAASRAWPRLRGARDLVRPGAGAPAGQAAEGPLARGARGAPRARLARERARARERDRARRDRRHRAGAQRGRSAAARAARARGSTGGGASRKRRAAGRRARGRRRRAREHG